MISCLRPLSQTLGVVTYNGGPVQTLVFLTNHRRFAASTIAQIYKSRWQIELFFKALKQNLRVKTFVGTSANALQIQIWTALIALLLLKYLQLRARFGWSLSNLAALLRQQLFVYRDRPFLRLEGYCWRNVLLQICDASVFGRCNSLQGRTFL